MITIGPLPPSWWAINLAEIRADGETTQAASGVRTLRSDGEPQYREILRRQGSPVKDISERVRYR
jgi:hypothetical protein